MVEQYALNWQVVLALVVLTGLIAAFVKPLLHLTRTITKLDITLENVIAQHKNEADANEKEHRRIYSVLDAHDVTIRKHDGKLSDICHKIGDDRIERS